MKFQLNNVNNLDKLEATNKEKFSQKHPSWHSMFTAHKAEQKKATMWFKKDTSRSSFRNYFQSNCAAASKKKRTIIH